jgi:CubicO group peptidase (beta-lactamase class C family)
VWADGKGKLRLPRVTSLDNPLLVNPDTLYELGSATKTFTATALMRLVAEGKVELDAPVRRYITETPAQE